MDQMNQVNCCINMMNMQDMGWMMAGMWFIGILLVLVLLLGIAALIKYLFLGRK